MQMSWATNQPNNDAQGRQARCEEGEGAVLDESKCEHIKRNVERACGQGVCPEWEVGTLNKICRLIWFGHLSMIWFIE